VFEVIDLKSNNLIPEEGTDKNSRKIMVWVVNIRSDVSTYWDLSYKTREIKMEDVDVRIRLTHGASNVTVSRGWIYDKVEAICPMGRGGFLYCEEDRS
ncbi:hypothetical protein PFISCL1PPCAC_25380, partial [Pristionchus fissidentatus]